MTSISNFGWFWEETQFRTNFVHLAILKKSDMTSISNFGWFWEETQFRTNFVHLAILKKSDMTSMSKRLDILITSCRWLKENNRLPFSVRGIHDQGLSQYPLIQYHRLTRHIPAKLAHYIDLVEIKYVLYLNIDLFDPKWRNYVNVFTDIEKCDFNGNILKKKSIGWSIWECPNLNIYCSIFS